MVSRFAETSPTNDWDITRSTTSNGSNGNAYSNPRSFGRRAYSAPAYRHRRHLGPTLSSNTAPPMTQYHHHHHQHYHHHHSAGPNQQQERQHGNGQSRFSNSPRFTSLASIRRSQHYSSRQNNGALQSHQQATSQTQTPPQPQQRYLREPEMRASLQVHQQSYLPVVRNGNGSRVSPRFQSKAVCRLACAHCQSHVCHRGMKAILLADTCVELFSTDSPPVGVQLVGPDYETQKCGCRIRDAACSLCGNVAGYHVTQPCKSCLDACNNGHFWMFHMGQVTHTERRDRTGSHVLLWAYIPPAHEDRTDPDVDTLNFIGR